MKRYKIKLWIIIIILCIMLINNGCLTMQYYPARVAKPGEMYFGVGLYTESYWEVEGKYVSIDGGGIYSGLFVRGGLPYNFDIGFCLHLLLFYPYILTVNARKQIDLNNDLIHAITFDVGYGWGPGDTEFYTSISMIRNNFAFTVGGEYINGEKFGGSTFLNYEKKALLIKVSNEHKYKRFNTMPFLYYRISKEYDDNSSFETFHEIGIGVSFYFDLL